MSKVKRFLNLSSLVLCSVFLFSCTSNSFDSTNGNKGKPYLPIFKLTENSTDKEKLDAYRESLDLMMIYANQLESELLIEKRFTDDTIRGNFGHREPRPEDHYRERAEFNSSESDIRN